MASGVDCCNSCPETQTTNIPGTPGATGPKGDPGDPATLLPAQAFYAVGGAQNLDTNNTQLLASTITLPADGDYLITAGVRIDFSNATTMTSKTVYLRLYKTNNGAATVTNTEHELATGIVTGESGTLCSTSFPAVVHSGSAGDIIQVQGSLSSLLTATYESGEVIAVETWMLALPIS
jgi:hypothetical protein